jgi:hypothetical protein
VPSTPLNEVAPGVRVVTEGLKDAEEGNIVGREGPRSAVKFLGRVSCIS